MEFKYNCPYFGMSRTQKGRLKNSFSDDLLNWLLQEYDMRNLKYNEFNTAYLDKLTSIGVFAQFIQKISLLNSI